MMSKGILCVAFAAPMSIVLHGCGGDTTSPAPSTVLTTTGSASNSSTTTVKVATTTVAPTPEPPPLPASNLSLPWDPATAVQNLNAMYMGFNEADDESPLGVTMSMAGQANMDSTFDDNLFCAPLMNTECYKGQADCRMSATLFNHRVVVSNDHFSQTMKRPVGYVFNPVLTEKYFGKCSYIWDGADSNGLNNGCGAGAPGLAECNNTLSAFNDLCSVDPTTPHTCTRTDSEVNGKLCKSNPQFTTETYGSVDPPEQSTDATCFYEMPALVYGDFTETNHFRDSLRQRIALQGNDTNKQQDWNEVVIDDRLLIPQVRANATNTILAFVCIPTNEIPDACAIAISMRDEFLTRYKVTGIPVVQIDTTLNITESGGPFVLPTTQSIIA